MPVAGGPQSFDPVFNPDKCTVAPIAPIPAIPNIEDCLVLPSPDTITDCIDPPVPFPTPGVTPAAGPAGPAGAPGAPGPGGPAGPPGQIQVLQIQVQDKCPQGLVLQVDKCEIQCNQNVCDCVVTIKKCPVTPQTPDGCCFQFSYLIQIPQTQGMPGPQGSPGMTGPQGPQGPQTCPSGINVVTTCETQKNQMMFNCIVTSSRCPKPPTMLSGPQIQAQQQPQIPPGGQSCCFQFHFVMQMPQVQDGAQGPTGPQGATGAGPQGPAGPQGAQGSQGPQGGKSAILAFYDDDGNWAAPEGPTGSTYPESDEPGRKRSKVRYLGLFCMEMPQPRFEDIMVLTVASEEDLPACIELDKRLMQFCADGSIEVVGTACNKPLVFGAEVVGNRIFIDGLKGQQFKDARLSIRVSGIRDDQQCERFPEYTEEQAKRNSTFWNQALSGDG